MSVESPNKIEHSPVARRLDELLATNPETARDAVGLVPVFDRNALILYGAGTLGRTTLTGLRAEGVEPAAFADDTPEKQGMTIEGIPVMTPRAAVERFGEDAIFAVTILNPRLSFLEARRRLQSQGCVRIVSFLDLAWNYPRSLLPQYQYELPRDLLSRTPDIRRAFEVWADEESRRQFAAHIEFRLHADYEALPASSGANYFPSDVPLPLNDQTTFVDCGAYDGDTIRQFLAQRQGRFREIYAFEPDAENFLRLRDFVAALDEDAAGRIHVFNTGVGSRRERLKFNATGDTAASFGGAEGIEVDVLPVDEVVAEDATACVYVKYDVEGAEMEALRGTEQLIARARPTLAVSVYHRPGDLWELPLYLASLDAGYSLFLRTQGADGMDLICYAVPMTNADAQRPELVAETQPSGRVPPIAC